MKARQKKKRKGKEPNQGNLDTIPQPPLKAEGGYPILSLRHLQPGFGVEEMSSDQCREFLVKWAKRSKITWKDLVQHGKHGLGSEKLPERLFKPQIPEKLKEDKYLVFRHEGNLPFVGIKAADIFHVLWIECEFGDLYDHQA